MKKLVLTLFLLIILMATNVFATTDVTMEIVEENICTIYLNEDSYFEKKIIDSDLANHEVTLQLKITNNSKVIIPEGELILLIDSSLSMDEVIEGETTRKNSILNSANQLVKNLLDANPDSLEIGIVTFSSSTEKNDEGFLITGTTADAKKVCDFTNDLSTLTNKISAIEKTGSYTNLDAGLQLAKKQFSNDDNNKYLIILTDGLPNLAVGYNDLVSYKGATDVINQTKSTLTSLGDISVITMLTGIDIEDAIFKTDGTNSYTYGQVITEIFGTHDAPTNGKFYKIDDNAIEQTITDDIYRDLLPIEEMLENIKISDYFPNYISDNFDITLLTEDSSNADNAKIMTDEENKKYISWDIKKLSPKETKTLKYTLSLKNEFNKDILDKVLDTNEKVDISFKDFDGTDKSKASDVTPKVKFLAPEPVPEPPKDVTIAPDSLPKAGSPAFAVAFALLLGITLFFGFKSRK